MADKINTFSVDCNGGMVTNLSPLQLSSQFPGSARSLINFEPNLEGGYRRISGSGKLLDHTGSTMRFTATRTFFVINGASTGDTSIVIGNLPDPNYFSFSGTKFLISGTEHTITNTSLSSVARELTLTITPALVANVSDGFPINISDADPVGFSVSGNQLFSSEYPVIRGISYGTFVGATTTVGYSLGQTPLTTTAKVNGASQTGYSLIIDNLSAPPLVGDCLKISGVNNVYTVDSITAYDDAAKTATLGLNKLLASSPSDNATISWVGFDTYGGDSQELRQYPTILTNTGQIFSDSSYLYAQGGNLRYSTTFLGCGTPLAFHKNQLFTRADSTKLVFSAPYSPFDFSPANGAGEINVDALIRDVKTYKDQLFIFCVDRILLLTGNTSADFALKPFSLDVGCPYADTVQQLGSDIIFLSNDGFRLISVTDKFGDFNAGSISNPIKSEVNYLVSDTEYAFGKSPTFTSISIPEKNQYRIFRKERDANGDMVATWGLCATLSADGSTVNWSVIDGLAVGNCSHSVSTSYSVFPSVVFYASSLGSSDPDSYGYIYAMEYGSTFDGTPIVASYKTPFYTFDDPRIRKSLNKLTVYCDKDAEADDIEFTVSPIFDLGETGVIQPSSISMGNINAAFGDTVGEVFETQLVGGGFTASFEISCTTDVPSFSIDNLVVEYMLHDRR